MILGARTIGSVTDDIAAQYNQLAASRPLVIAGGVVVLAGLGYFLYYRLKRRRA